MALSAAKALAAAHLAVCRGAFASNLQWAPTREERQDAFQHTARTLKLMVASGSHALPGLIATHLMLCLVEMSLGTKHGLQRYSSSIDNLVFRHSSQLEATENGQRLLQAAYDTQATSRLFAGPWRFTHEPRSMWVQRGFPTSIVVKDITSQAFVIGERYLLLCAARDNARDPNALLSALVGQFWQALAPQDMVDALGDLTDAQLSTACEEAIKTLQSLAETIHGIPPPPMDREFPTHEATLDAARYAQCCILCDVALLRDLVTRAPPSCKEPNRWLRIMLDIANSLDISQSATQDLWGCSLVTMLARGAVRCSAPQGFAAVETYMDKIASTGVSWVDTGFSTDVIRPHFATLRDQVERGRKVIITAPSSSSYSEQNPTLDARLGTEWYIYGVESDGRRFVEEVQSIQ